MNKEQLKELHDLKFSVQGIFKNRCYIDRETCTAKTFSFHHLWYICMECQLKFGSVSSLKQHEEKTGHRVERVYSDFKDNLEYHRYLVIKIRQNQKRFLMVCAKKHFLIGRGTQWGKKKFGRYVKAVRMTVKS